MVAVVVSLFLVGVIAIGSMLGFNRIVRHFTESTADFKLPAGPTQIVHITPGSSIRAIGKLLQEAGVVKSKGAFVAAAKSNSASAGLHPGTFRLAEHLPASVALSRLLDPGAQVLSHVVIPEGRTTKEIVTILAAQTGIDAAKFNAVLAQPASYGLPDWAKNPDGHRSEGFLFPATYDFQPDANARTVLSAMTKRFDAAAAATGLLTKPTPNNLTPFQVLTVAGLVQAEAKRVEDMPKIAQVIYNRLAKGMALQLDTTVLYANGGARTLTTSAAQRGVDSPYNTYRVTGLPPGPIDSPGEAAIKAALAPQAGPWLYFVAVNPESGETRFATTEAEHQQNVTLFRQWARDHPSVK